jgi:hypothetical protein
VSEIASSSVISRDPIRFPVSKSKPIATQMLAYFARSGGLKSYGPNLDDLYRTTGAMAGKILKGTNAALLPAERPTRFELIVKFADSKSTEPGHADLNPAAR